MVRPINFVHNGGENYAKVQEQIFGLIRAELGDHPVSETVLERREDAINFGIFIRRGRYENSRPFPVDVLMSHGLADKNYLFAGDVDTGERLVNSYEHVLVPGQWYVDRLRRNGLHPLRKQRVRLRPDQVHVVGWPRLDPRFREAAGREGAGDGRLRLLWAPSHNISKKERPFSSYPAFERFLPALQERFDVRVSLHPSNRTDKSPTSGDLNWADVVVSDFGTMLYEAFALDKCVIMPTWLLPPKLGQRARGRLSAEAYIYSKRVGNHARSFDELVAMAERNEPPGERVKRFMARVLAPEYQGRSSARVAELLKTLPLRRMAG